MKFKVGDKVRVVDNVGVTSIKSKYIGKVFTIGDIDNGSYPYSFKPDIGWAWCDKELELVHEEKIVITTDGKTTTATLYHDNMKTVATARCASEDTFDFNVGAKLAMDRLMVKVKPVTFCGFKVGDRVHLGEFNGTVICIAVSEPWSTSNDLGVEFDDVPNHPGMHGCGGIDLADGKTGADKRCKWCYAKELEHGEYVPKYYNGKVVCVNNVCNSNTYTVGKIYEFVDGTFKCDTGHYVHEFTMAPSKFKSFNDWRTFSTSEWLEIKE